MSTPPVLPDDFENLPPELQRRSKLIKPDTALLDPQTGQPTFVGSPQQVLSKANANLPSAEAMMGPDPLNPADSSQLARQLPFIGQPTLAQATAASPQTGMPPPALANPGLSKLGKLLAILGGGVQGALAGRAASEQAVIQSGGKRSGGAGMGLEAGYQLPFLRALQNQQVQKGQAETQEAQQQAAPVPTPYGNLPGWLAKTAYPAIVRSDSAQNVQGMKGQTAEDIQGQKSQTALSVAGVNQRYKAVPNVGMFDTQTRQVIPGTAQGITVTPEIAQDYGLPDDFVGKPMKMSDFSGLERNQIATAPTVKTSTDPLGMTTTSTSRKQMPGGMGGGVARGGGGTARPVAPSGQPSGGGSSSLDNMAQQLVEGTMDPSQVPKRSAAYAMILQRANLYSQQKYGQPFDIAGATSDYQYAKNPQTQNTLKMINAMTDKGGSIEIAQKAATKLPQMDSQTINKVFNIGQTEFGSQDVTNFHTAMLGLADEYSKVMGGGVSSDTGRQQGLDLLKAAYSKGQMGGAIDIMHQDIAARKSALVGSNRYLMKQYAAATPAATGAPSGDQFAQFGGKAR